MSAFLLTCFLNMNVDAKIYFKDVNNCLYYAEKLTEQSVQIPEKVESYKCMCKLVAYVNDKRDQSVLGGSMLQALIGPVTSLVG